MKRTLLYVVVIILFGINQTLFSQTKSVEVTSKRNDDKSVDISYTKRLPGSYYINVEFTSIQNCYQRSFSKVVKQSSGRLVTLKPINENNHINFSYRISYIQGHPNPKVDKDFVYVLPFKEGKTIKVLETTSLKETYLNAKKDTSWKSYIVDRPIADTVYSMRKGIVVDVKADVISKPDTYKYTSEMNSVTVEHEDGTLSRYTGFNKNNVYVKLGQDVYPQTKLGVLDVFNNSLYRLYFDVSYLKKIDFKTNKSRTLASENQKAHITPYFHSSKGPIVLKNNNEYEVEINETVLFEEFTRREKKKYKKNPKIFK